MLHKILFACETEFKRGADMIDFMLTLCIGAVIGYTFFKLKVPGGMMVGSIVGVSALNILTGHALMPATAKLSAQIIAGAFIGVSVEKEDLIRLKKIWRPAITLVSGMMILNLISGYLIYKFSPLDLVTSLMCAVPGGMSDIPIISADMGADASKVAVMQFIRLVAGIGVFPGMIAFIAKRRSEDVTPVKVNTRKSVVTEDPTPIFLTTMAVAIGAGLIGKAVGIPAGALLFALISVIILKMTKHKAWLPKWIKRLAQVLSGAYIGSGIFMADVLEIRFLAIPAIILLSGYFSACLLIGWFIHSRFGMSLKESMLAATPAGASDMALIASDLGIEGTDVVVLQIIRMLFVVLIFPQVINLIVVFAGR